MIIKSEWCPHDSTHGINEILCSRICEWTWQRVSKNIQILTTTHVVASVTLLVRPKSDVWLMIRDGWTNRNRAKVKVIAACDQMYSDWVALYRDLDTPRRPVGKSDLYKFYISSIWSIRIDLIGTSCASEVLFFSIQICTWLLLRMYVRYTYMTRHTSNARATCT